MKAPSPTGRSPPGAMPAPASSSSRAPAKSARQSMNAAWPALVGGTRRISVGIGPFCHPPRSATPGSLIEQQAPAADGAPPIGGMGPAATRRPCTEGSRHRLGGVVAGVDAQHQLADARLGAGALQQGGGDGVAVPAAAVGLQHPVGQRRLAPLDPGTQQRQSPTADQLPLLVTGAGQGGVLAQRSVGAPARDALEERLEPRAVPAPADDLRASSPSWAARIGWPSPGRRGPTAITRGRPSRGT